jgi:hypothetical protein
MSASRSRISPALGAVVERGDQFDRALQLFEIGLQLGLDVGVEHIMFSLFFNLTGFSRPGTNATVGRKKAAEICELLVGSY